MWFLVASGRYGFLVRPGFIAWVTWPGFMTHKCELSKGKFRTELRVSVVIVHNELWIEIQVFGTK